MLEPIDYLLIGHITIYHSANGDTLGGTVTYSALTAQALGLRVGIVTSWGEELKSRVLSEVSVINHRAEKSTIFENIYTDQGRIQKIQSVAKKIEPNDVPQEWRNVSMVHLGPVAREIAPSIIQKFKSSFMVSTPQGWMRSWGDDGLIKPGDWLESKKILQRLNAVVVSAEDLDHDEERINEFVRNSAILAVTDGSRGTRLFWKGKERKFTPPPVQEVDATGAGDIFATCFFIRLYTTLDPWEACRFATVLAAYSVTRKGMEGIPTEKEIVKTLKEMGN